VGKIIGAMDPGSKVRMIQSLDDDDLCLFVDLLPELSEEQLIDLTRRADFRVRQEIFKLEQQDSETI
jgi:hypothetical protein